MEVGTIIELTAASLCMYTRTGYMYTTSIAGQVSDVIKIDHTPTWHGLNP